MSTERILVHKPIAQDFTAALKEATQKVFGSESPSCVLVNCAAVQKNKRLVTDVVSKGATVLLGTPEAAEALRCRPSCLLTCLKT